MTGTVAGQGGLGIPQIVGQLASHRLHMSVILRTRPEEQPQIDAKLAPEKKMRVEGSAFLRPLVESIRTWV